jgi:hypothetical protein
MSTSNVNITKVAEKDGYVPTREYFSFVKAIKVIDIAK